MTLYPASFRAGVGLACEQDWECISPHSRELRCVDEPTYMVAVEVPQCDSCGSFPANAPVVMFVCGELGVRCPECDAPIVMEVEWDGSHRP